MPHVLYPRALASGDLIAIAAPSGPLRPGDESSLARGVKVIESMGFRVRLAPLVDTSRRRWWAAGSPSEHAAELNALLRDPQVRAIVAHTGGNVTFSYLDLLDLEAVRADPKPILGYSDISVLHLALHAKTGLVGFHADLATPGFGNDWFVLGNEDRRQQLVALYTNLLTGEPTSGPLPAVSEWECWNPGRAEGRLLGGLLNRLIRLQATPFALSQDRFDGAILFWEETGRTLEWVWNDLQILRISGVLDRIAGMVIGIPKGVESVDGGPTPPSLREAVLDVVGDRDLPVLAHVDFGHTSPNLLLPIGVRAEIDAGAKTLSLLESAVARPGPGSIAATAEVAPSVR